MVKRKRVNQNFGGRFSRKAVIPSRCSQLLA
jgi:hypothetical protein